MIIIFKNKHLKITICLILIFTISINFIYYQKVQAVGITAGLAIKAMAVILSSMGVLHVVQNNGGIQSFFDSFTLFNHEGLNALRDMAINNIVHNVKIKANNVIASIREFFNSWAVEELSNPFDIGDNVKFTDTVSRFETIDSSTSGTKIYLFKDHVIYEDDFNKISISSYFYRGSVKADRGYSTELYVNDSLLFRDKAPLISSTSHPLYQEGNYYFKYQYQISDEFLIYNWDVTNYNENYSDIATIRRDVQLLALSDAPYLDPTYDIPQPQSLPRNGVDIAWDEATNKSISYIPEETKLEKLIEDIANASVETFVENYTSWGKATTDSLTGPIIRTETRVNQETGVEEQVVTDVTETVFDEMYEETHTQTGLLGSILGILTDIKDFIISIFIPEEFNALDFTPLQNIGLADKFPFSLPWDLKNSVVALSATPEAPQFEVPIVTEIINLDFSEFESWASIIRVFTTLIFVIALIILTRRLI